MIANTAVYRHGKPLHVDVAPDDLAGIRAAVAAGQPGDFVSLGLHEPDKAEMARVAAIFGLHALAVEDSLHPVQRPKLEKYGDMVFLVLRVLSTEGKSRRIHGGQIALFMGPDYVITVRQATSFPLESVRADVEKHPEVLQQGPPAVVYAVSDRVVDAYEEITATLSAQVDTVEDEVFSGSRAHVSRRINELDRQLSTLRRAVHPLQDPIEQFAHGEITGVTSEGALYFRDVADHVTRVGEELDALDGQLSGAFNGNLSRIGIQQNDDMRRMSAWAAIAAVITVLAGIYGMNFSNMPELTWSFGYPAAILVMVGLSVWLYSRFKKSGWL